MVSPADNIKHLFVSQDLDASAMLALSPKRGERSKRHIVASILPEKFPIIETGAKRKDSTLSALVATVHDYTKDVTGEEGGLNSKQAKQFKKNVETLKTLVTERLPHNGALQVQLDLINRDIKNLNERYPDKSKT